MSLMSRRKGRHVKKIAREESEAESTEGKIVKALNKSPINYFSDLFVMAMVVAWIIVDGIMVVVATWATVVIADTSVWPYVQELTGIPLTAGGAIWMVKNAVQHALASKDGKECKQDFPKVPVDDDNMEQEVRIGEEIEGG